MRMHQGQVEKKRSQSHLKDELGLEIMEASQSKVGSNKNSSSDLHASQIDITGYSYLREVMKIKNNKGLSLDEKVYHM
jgi:hypothetical protein